MNPSPRPLHRSTSPRTEPCLLADVIPSSPAELLDVAQALDDWRRFLESCRGVAWPSLEQQVANPRMVLVALAEVRRSGRSGQDLDRSAAEMAGGRVR